MLPHPDLYLRSAFTNNASRFEHDIKPILHVAGVDALLSAALPSPPATPSLSEAPCLPIFEELFGDVATCDAAAVDASLTPPPAPPTHAAHHHLSAGDVVPEIVRQPLSTDKVSKTYSATLPSAKLYSAACGPVTYRRRAPRSKSRFASDHLAGNASEIILVAGNVAPSPPAITTATTTAIVKRSSSARTASSRQLRVVAAATAVAARARPLMNARLRLPIAPAAPLWPAGGGSGVFVPRCARFADYCKPLCSAFAGASAARSDRPLADARARLAEAFPQACRR